jgi:GNAT superfamily N-acetyltransferase
MEAVRAAGTDDRQRFDELLDELVGLVVVQRGGPLLLAAAGSTPMEMLGATSYEELLADRQRRVLLGTLDRVVTGLAVCHVEPMADGSRLGVIDACYVEPEARGIGLGHLLADAAISWLQGQACTGVDGTALPGDRLAKGFFESSGFKARLLTMHHPFE